MLRLLFSAKQLIGFGSGSGPARWSGNRFMAHNENGWCLTDWDELENPANKTRGFLAGVPKESHRLVARNPACGLVRSCYCEHVASLSRSRRVSGSRRVVLCDTPGWETLPLRIRSAGFEAPHSGGPAFNAGDTSGQPPSRAGLEGGRVWFLFQFLPIGWSDADGCDLPVAACGT